VTGRRRTGGGASIWEGDGAGMVGTKRRKDGAIGIFTGAMAFFGRRRGGGGSGCLHGHH
jgi:hypothetical protein